MKSQIHLENVTKVNFKEGEWGGMENIVLSEIRQSEEDKYRMISLIRGI